MADLLHIDLDRTSPVPLYHQVASAIDAAIADGRLPPGQLLENEIALAARLGISRPTARQALRGLVDQGRLVRRRGVGTQVAPARFRRPVELTSLADDLARHGRAPGTRVLEHTVVPAGALVAAAMELTEGTSVVLVRRLRSADDEPLAVMTNYLPVAIAPDADELATTGLYDALRRRGRRPRTARQQIGARLATAAEARMLEESPRSAVLTMARTAWDEDGSVIEYGTHVYRASRYQFDTTLFTG
ncbi:MAG: GntR family transcriptional regulator [Actinobacteria bacterium]|nr:GntR family transcriptional regulator [Actinomycetota bacterium]MCG2797701.1 GntR family transcriptional regulator [Cellulomonas sp.]